MALFDPGKILGSLVASMGLTPDYIRQFVAEIWDEFRAQKTEREALKAEREAFKKACQIAVPDIIARLERIEKNQNTGMVPVSRLEDDHERQPDHGNQPGHANGHADGHA